MSYQAETIEGSNVSFNEFYDLIDHIDAHPGDFSFPVTIFELTVMLRTSSFTREHFSEYAIYDGKRIERLYPEKNASPAAPGEALPGDQG